MSVKDTAHKITPNPAPDYAQDPKLSSLTASIGNIWRANQQRLGIYEVEALLQDFGKDAKRAEVVLNSLAQAGALTSLNGVVNLYRSLTKQYGPVAILNICPASINGVIHYLYNKAFFKDHQQVPDNPKIDINQVRISDTHVTSYSHFEKWQKNNGLSKDPRKAVVFLDNALLDYYQSHREDPYIRNQFERIFKDPNVLLISPSGYDLGASAINWDPHKVKGTIGKVLELVGENSDEGYLRHATEKFVSQSDTWIKVLKDHGSQYALVGDSAPFNRFYQIHSTFKGRGDWHEEPEVTNNRSVSLLNFDQPDITESHLKRFIGEFQAVMPTMLSSLVQALKEQVKIYTWHRLSIVAQDLNAKVEAAARILGKEPLYVIPKSGKSFSVAAEVYRQANHVKTGKFLNFEQFVKESGKPGFEEKYAVVVLDDLAGTGVSMEKIIRLLKRKKDLSGKDNSAIVQQADQDETQRQNEGGLPALTANEIKFHGDIIIAPLVGCTYARDFLLKGNYEKIHFICGDEITPYYDSQLIRRAPDLKNRLAIIDMLKSSSGSLGFKDLGLMVSFPWGAPNNIPGLFYKLAPLFVHNPASVKPPYTPGPQE